MRNTFIYHNLEKNSLLNALLNLSDKNETISILAKSNLLNVEHLVQALENSRAKRSYLEMMEIYHKKDWKIVSIVI